MKIQSFSELSTTLEAAVHAMRVMCQRGKCVILLFAAAIELVYTMEFGKSWNLKPGSNFRPGISLK